VVKLNYSIHLMKETICEFKDCILEEKGLDEYDLKDECDVDGTIYYKHSDPRDPPAWYKFIDSALSSKDSSSESNVLPFPEQHSLYGILLIRAESRIFAFTFGYGYTCINIESREADFGMRTALNMVDHQKIREIDKKSLNYNTLHTISQSLKGLKISNFGIDLNDDLVKGISGKSNDTEISDSITGSISLKVTNNNKIRDLPQLCKKLLEYYLSENYKDHFQWYDNFKLITDKNTISSLNETLLGNIKESCENGNETDDNLSLEFPDYIDLNSSRKFEITNSDKISQTFEIDDFKFKNLYSNDVFSKSDDFTSFDKIKVKLYNPDAEEEISTWKLFDCVYFFGQVTKDKLHNILIDGKWYEISADQVENTDKYLEDVDKTNKMPLRKFSGSSSEDEYIKSLISEKKSYLKFHRKNISVPNPGGLQRTNSVEFCDLYDHKEKRIIHIKIYSASAGINHLCSQISTSAIFFLKDEDFREKIINKTDEDDRKNLNFSKNSRPIPMNYKLVFAIIHSKKEWSITILPIMAKMTLKKTIEELELLGYNVQIECIGTKDK